MKTLEMTLEEEEAIKLFRKLSDAQVRLMTAYIKYLLWTEEQGMPFDQDVHDAICDIAQKGAEDQDYREALAYIKDLYTVHA